MSTARYGIAILTWVEGMDVQPFLLQATEPELLKRLQEEGIGVASFREEG